MYRVAGTSTGGANAARHAMRPGVYVVQGVADHGWFAGGATRRVYARESLTRHGKHAKRIAVAQIGFGGEGEFRQIGKAFAILGMHTGSVKLAAVDR